MTRRTIPVLFLVLASLASVGCLEYLMESPTAPSSSSSSNSSTSTTWQLEPVYSGLSQACSGYTVDNYQSVFERNKNGRDVQLHTHCANTFNYYWMYRNARDQGYTKEQARVTYLRHVDAAKVTIQFWQQTCTNVSLGCRPSTGF